MRASLLFYRKLQIELEEFRFMVSPYNPCIAIMKAANGKQLMVIWHMDNLMASCKDNFELTRFLCYLARIYVTRKLKMHISNKYTI
jgi:hypothetical protein